MKNEVESMHGQMENPSHIAIKPKLAFHSCGNADSQLHVSYTLHLPATKTELDTFLKAARKFTGSKVVEIAHGLSAEFVRGGDIKGLIAGNRRSVAFDFVEDAIDEYFNLPEGETLIIEDVETAEGGDSDDGETTSPTEN